MGLRAVRARRFPLPPAALTGRPAWRALHCGRVSQGPAALASKRVKPSPADIKFGPSGVPFWGTETVREDKGLSKALHHKTVTEVGATAAWPL